MAFGLLAGCSSGTSAGDAASTSDAGFRHQGQPADQPITISVVSLIPGSEQAAFDAFDARVKQFEGLPTPPSRSRPQEYEWKATTFAAQLAGGTLPDVFEIPLTDAKTLIENGRLADIDAQFHQLSYADQFNPTLLESGQGRRRQGLRDPGEVDLRRRAALQP